MYPENGLRGLTPKDTERFCRNPKMFKIWGGKNARRGAIIIYGERGLHFYSQILDIDDTEWRNNHCHVKILKCPLLHPQPSFLTIMKERCDLNPGPVCAPHKLGRDMMPETPGCALLGVFYVGKINKLGLAQTDTVLGWNSLGDCFKRLYDILKKYHTTWTATVSWTSAVGRICF